GGRPCHRADFSACSTTAWSAQRGCTMHELAITQDIVAIVADHARGTKVKRVVLEIGQLAAVLPDAIRFSFDLCTQGTVLEGAILEIIPVPGQARCRQCDAEVALDRPVGRCRCGSLDLEWLAGEELKIKEMELA